MSARLHGEASLTGAAEALMRRIDECASIEACRLPIAPAKELVGLAYIESFQRWPRDVSYRLTDAGRAALARAKETKR